MLIRLRDKNGKFKLSVEFPEYIEITFPEVILNSILFCIILVLFKFLLQ